MRFHHRVDDVEAEAQTFPATRLLPAGAKRFEEVWQLLGIDHSIIRDGDPHRVWFTSVETHGDGLALSAVLQRVANEIGQHLCETRFVPGPAQVTRGFQLDGASGARAEMIGHH